MKHPLYIAGIALAILVAAWVVFSEWHVSARPGQVVGTLPQPSVPVVPTTPAPKISRHQIEQSRISLGKITGASFQEVYHLLAGRNSRELAELARQFEDLKPGGVTDAAVALFFKAWSQLDPKAALTTALSFDKTWLKTAALQSVVDGVEPAAAGELVNSLASLPQTSISGGFRSQLLGQGITKWSETDPAGAAAFLDSAGGRMVSSEAWRNVAEHWAASDPKAALEWAGKQGDAEKSRDAMQGMISGWWQKDPSGAADYAAAHANTFEGSQLSAIVGNKMASEDPAQAASWAAKLPDAQARRHAELAIAMPWAYNDAQAASAWAAKLPDEERGPAASAVAGAWAQSDPQAAAQWANSLTGAVRDSAVASFSAAVSATDPATALSWAETVSDAKTRDSATQNIVRSWLMRDPAAAQSWIEKSALPREEKLKLLGSSGP